MIHVPVSLVVASLLLALGTTAARAQYQSTFQVPFSVQSSSGSNNNQSNSGANASSASNYSSHSFVNPQTSTSLVVTGPSVSNSGDITASPIVTVSK